MVNVQQFYLFGQIQTIQTGGQLYGYISPNNEYTWQIRYLIDENVKHDGLPLR